MDENKTQRMASDAAHDAAVAAFIKKPVAKPTSRWLEEFEQPPSRAMNHWEQTFMGSLGPPPQYNKPPSGWQKMFDASEPLPPARQYMKPYVPGWGVEPSPVKDWPRINKEGLDERLKRASRENREGWKRAFGTPTEPAPGDLKSEFQQNLDALSSIVSPSKTPYNYYAKPTEEEEDVLPALVLNKSESLATTSAAELWARYKTTVKSPQYLGQPL